jgi:pimeloyl-ACP methyl ester carboxylesterase
MLAKVFARLPPELQDRTIETLLQTGLFSRADAFEMLFETMVFMGADPVELRALFRRVEGLDRSGTEPVRAFARDVREEAERAEKASDNDLAVKRYRQAAVYFLLSDRLTADWDTARTNYEGLLPAFDRFREVHRPSIEKIEFPYEEGSLYAHLRLPQGEADQLPAVVIVQGNDSVKELMTPFEDIALERGLATVTIDRPGWGESGLSGTRFRSLDDLARCAELAADFLADHDRIASESIGVFGVSYGGLLAPLCAGLEPRFAAVVELGGPIYHPERIEDIWNAAPEVMVRRSYRYTGTETREELVDWTRDIVDDVFDVLNDLTCPAKMVHGSADRLVPVDDAYALADEIGESASVKTVPGGNHMCTGTLPDYLAPYLFNWLKTSLESERYDNR